LPNSNIEQIVSSRIDAKGKLGGFTSTENMATTISTTAAIRFTLIFND
jgi:L-rhamnose isomerase